MLKFNILGVNFAKNKLYLLHFFDNLILVADIVVLVYKLMQYQS